MTMRISKTIFTSAEMNRIIGLVRELETADESKKKGIRSKIRKIGLYWSEVASGMAYTVANLKALLNDGTLKLSDSDKYDVGEAYTKKTIEEKEISPFTPLKMTFNKEFKTISLEGFEGFKSVSELRSESALLPKEAGVYVVIRDSTEAPQFLEKGTGGFFKGKNPNVSITELAANYVADSNIVYIGKASSLRRRVGQLLRFGEGKAVGHWGGRYLWQLDDSDNLLVAWKVTPNCDSSEIESQMIREFTLIHGKRPFANLKD